MPSIRAQAAYHEGGHAVGVDAILRAVLRAGAKGVDAIGYA
jgi:hypothetical protein